MRSSAIHFSAILVLLAVLGSGCGPNHVRHTQTTLLPDGSVDRAVLLPLKDTPEAVVKEGCWTQTTYLRQKSFDYFTGEIRKLPVQSDFPEGKADEAFVAGWRKFAPDEKLPEHFIKHGLDESKISHFEQHPSVRDYGLVTEYVWHEVLTEVCEFNDATNARRELAAIFCDQVEFTLKHGLDPSYDATELVAWLRGEGSQWVEELALIHWSECANNQRAHLGLLFVAALGPMQPAEPVATIPGEAVKTPENNELPQKVRPTSSTIHNDGFAIPLKRIEECCQRHQLTVRLAAGFGDQNEKAVEAFARQLIQRTVKRRNGLDIEPDVLTLLAHFGKPDAKTVAEATQKKWDAALSEFEENPPGKKAFEERRKQLLTRIWGVNGAGLFVLAHSERFQATQTMPGQIVETNGTLLGDRVVRWKFTTAEAFPDGYDMQVRSIVISPERLPGLAANWSTDRVAALKLIELAQPDAPLTAALKDCRKHRSLAPLKTYADSISDGDQRKRAAAAMKLLRGE